jgi:hypothetical protein
VGSGTCALEEGNGDPHELGKDAERGRWDIEREKIERKEALLDPVLTGYFL